MAGVDFAILSPVPARHLHSGLLTLERNSFVAYGSQKFEFFEQVDKLRG